MHVQLYIATYIPYSTKYPRDKTSAFFVVFQQTTNVFSRIFKNHIALLSVNGSSKTPIHNPESSLSRVVNQADIEAANEVVLKVYTEGLGAK